MPKVFLKILPALIFWGIFVWIILAIPYPDSLAQANLGQIILFFASLSLALTRSLNIFLKNIPLSLSITLCLIFLLILKALDSLNIVTGLLILISAGLLSSYFQKTKRETGRIRKIRGIGKIRENKLNRV